MCSTTGTADPQLSDPHISDLSTGLHLVTLFLDDDWAGRSESPCSSHFT